MKWMYKTEHCFGVNNLEKRETFLRVGICGRTMGNFGLTISVKARRII